MKKATVLSAVLVVASSLAFGQVNTASLTGLVDRKSTRLNSSHLVISYAVFCLKKKKKSKTPPIILTHLPEKPQPTSTITPITHSITPPTDALVLRHTPPHSQRVLYRDHCRLVD